MADFKVGDVVVMIDDRFHDHVPEFYPEAGTVGKVRRISDGDLLVKWPKKTTSGDDTWYICSWAVRRLKK